MSTPEKNNIFTKLEQSFFVLGDLYVERKKSPRIKYLKAGDFIDQIHLQKLKKMNSNQLIFQELIHPDYVKEGISLWSDFKDAKDESEKNLCREKILSWFKEGFWDGKKEVSFLDLVYVHQKVFCRFDQQTLAAFWNSSTMICRRSALLSSLVVPFVLFSGYTDFEFLSDVYHTAFLMDAAFDQNHFSYLLAQACEVERKKEDGGVALPSEEREFFFNHPKKSYEAALKSYGKYFYDSSVLKMILKHHEKTAGTGWPHQVSEADTSEVENILISLNQMISYDERVYLKNDGMAFMRDFLVCGDSLRAKRFERFCRGLFRDEEPVLQAKGA